MYNKVAHTFRDEYASILVQASTLPPLPAFGAPPRSPEGDRLKLLQRLGILSEEEVRHPRLPLRGFIDLLVRRDGRTAVLDFKTGAEHAEHRDQVLLYALMWWRSTGDLPATIELRYGARAEGWPVAEAELRHVEQELDAKIRHHRAGMVARPAAASLGPHCSGCSARQMCDDYWVSRGDPRAESGDSEWVDLEVVVQTTVAKTGFFGLDRKGEDIALVFEETATFACGPFAEGERLRILGAIRDAGTSTFRVTRATEVFRVS